MRLMRIFLLLLRAEPWALARGAALAVVVLVAGVALLGLSGWFITAAGVAGLAGLGAVFNVFGPGAGVRGLAYARTAARWGERLLTHDATLRALAALRVALLARLSGLPHAAMARLRGAEALNRLTADVDALDGVALRLGIPLMAGAVTLAATAAGLAWLVAPAVGAWSVASFALGGAGALWWAAARAARPARRAERAGQALRVRLIDLARAQADLAVMGRLAAQRDAVLAAQARLAAERARVDAVERRAGLMLGLAGTLAAGGVLWLAGTLAQGGAISVAQAALGFFATLALAEVAQPLRRAMADLGRMQDAARRVTRQLDAPPEARAQGPAPAPVPGAPVLALEGVRVLAPHAARTQAPTQAPHPPERALLSLAALTVAAGETVALTGRSGAGKSTLLHLAAGLARADAGTVRLLGHPVAAWPEAALRARVALLPQRSALMRGTVFDALALACPGLTPAMARDVLAAVRLEGVVARMGGLDARLGDGGAGLSGGEARRLALARVLLRRPALLLLDEPTEGLDAPTARAVLAGVRAWVPEAAILMASHRAAERAAAGRIVALGD